MKNKSKHGQLPKGALAKISLGQSFAEYDRVLKIPGVFVETPAIRAALDDTRSKCFFVGRRGTGKTAITYYISQRTGNTISILPQMFAPLGRFFRLDEVKDTRQRPFKSLVSCFKRALAAEVLHAWRVRGLLDFDRVGPQLQREEDYAERFDFDLRLLTFVEKIFTALNNADEKEWLRDVKRSKEVLNEMNDLRDSDRYDYTILLDRLDESWDGSDQAVVLLMALMHACVEISATSECIRPLLFVRENIFERVRGVDNEFSRLETFVVSLDWSKELLLEFVERRLNVPLTTKLPLRGPTWDAFFETIHGESARDYVFNYCQDRPRDVLTYCSFAIESAQSRKHERIGFDDLQEARRRFSDSRLKDLGDEYAENFPQLQLVLSRFFGLGREFTVPGITAFIQKLLTDDDVKRHCSSWIYGFTQPDRFIQLLYDIGFVGIKNGASLLFRTLGPKSSSPPPIGPTTSVIVHPSYSDALNLQNMLVGSLDENTPFRRDALIADLPGAIDLDAYRAKLLELQEDLKTLPRGDEAAERFEEIIGDVIKLCFFRSLTNVQRRVRNHDGRVIRDWIAANHAASGFWEMVRQRYSATQIIWECKNFADLSADSFQQVAYYMTQEIGRFAIICFRGNEVKKHYYEHIKRVAVDKDGLILLLMQRDLEVFLRQAIKGKAREDHIREIYDKTLREIS